MKGELQTHNVAVEDLSANMRREMFALFETYYEAVSYESFERDLLAKRLALLLKDPSGAIRGFTTVQVLERAIEGRRLRAVFSGDTIIHHEFRGEHTLVISWHYLMGRIKAEAPELPLYWFLIVKGDKTYRYLPALFRRYYPVWDGSAPYEYKIIADTLALEKFGRDFDPKTGVVRFSSSMGHLRPECAEPRKGLEKRPEVRFFLERNPGFRQGHELVCLTELSSDNMRLMARKPFEEGLKNPYSRQQNPTSESSSTLTSPTGGRSSL